MQDPENYMNLLCESATVRLSKEDVVCEGKKLKLLGGLLVLAGIAITKKRGDVKEWAALSKLPIGKVYAEYGASKAVSVITHTAQMLIIDMVAKAEDKLEGEDLNSPKAKQAYNYIASQESKILIYASERCKKMIRNAKNDEDKSIFMKGAVKLQKKAEKVRNSIKK